jgi:hypothetical protein
MVDYWHWFGILYIYIFVNTIGQIYNIVIFLLNLYAGHGV